MRLVISILGALVLASAANAQSARPISLVAIISNPDAASGQYVSTMGVLSLRDTVQLCIDKESIKYEIALNCIAIQNDDSLISAVGTRRKILDGAYVQVIGTFDSSAPKPRLFVGVIRDVAYIRPLPL